MFSVSEYLSRIEQAALDILESMKPIDKTITLWWGLDGLRLNEDGTTEWVSRKKKSVETVSYQPCQSIRPIHAGIGGGGGGGSNGSGGSGILILLSDKTQSTRAQIDALMAQNAALQTQCIADARNAKIANMIQQCCVQYPAQYPPYYYGGCCCNFMG